ncbi:MAG: UTP--glucose-1-phosphate uridylyltransferase [Caldilineaceae bacterium]
MGIMHPPPIKENTHQNGYDNGARNGSNGRTTQMAYEHSGAAKGFDPFASKMRRHGLPEALIETFQHYYKELLQGETGYISSQAAQPVKTLPLARQLGAYAQAGKDALARTVVLKLNGGLGSTMGLEMPKSLLEVKEGFSFLDIIVRQHLYLRREHGVELPLIFMNSFNTEEATRAALQSYPALIQNVPLDFRQHKIPKIWQHDLSPATWEDAPEKEWCPPGHGNLYLAFYTSGILTQLVDSGYEYAFISNVDNLGATLDLTLLGYLAERNLPFLMEATARTPADSKGGHLAQSAAQGLILREVAQCPPAELELFQDTARYRYFNTNNIWINLAALKEMLEQNNGFIDLPLIRNEKPVDPTSPASALVYQLETAMGQAIAVFPGAQAVEVGRERFLPVKRTSDLLALRSDLYLLARDYTIRRNPARKISEDVIIELDEEFYGSLEQFEAHFANGTPSLVNCRRLQIEGEIFF